MLALVLYLALTFALYGSALDSYFVAEDIRSVEFGWSDVATELSASGVSVGLRPGTVLYFVLNNSLWGRNPVGYHAVTFCLHALTGWFTYLIAAQTTGNQVTATVAGLLFTSAPVHTESAVWLAAAAGTVTSGLICTFVAWLWVREKAPPGAWTIGIGAVLYLAAILTKETAIPLLALLLLLDISVNRSFVQRSLVQRIHRLLAYWPFGVVLGVYAVLYWRAGILQASVRYGAHGYANLRDALIIWASHAWNLFQPWSNLVSWTLGVPIWSWLIALLVLLLVARRARWTGIWILASLLPASTALGDRLTYLAVTGFAVLAAEASVGITLAIQASQRSRILRHTTVVVACTILALTLYASGREIRRDIANWERAGELTWSIPRQARELVPDVPADAELFFVDLPERVGNAYAYSWGIVPEVRHVYNIPNLKVYHVVFDGRPWPKVDHMAIACQADVPRYFFQFDAASDQVRAISLSELRPDCSAPRGRTMKQTFATVSRGIPDRGQDYD